jgi:hypothetical protein
MNVPRVKRGPGPKGVLTKNTYRRKALKFLKADFGCQCAYCLQSSELQHANQTHVDHFDPHKPNRSRNAYSNLMLACSGCNLNKHDKFVQNPFNKSQRLLDCTKENEFPQHIVETSDGRWTGKTEEGIYHIATIELNEPALVRNRAARRELIERLKALEAQTSFTYTGGIDAASFSALTALLQTVRSQLQTSIPLVTDFGLQPFNSA